MDERDTQRRGNKARRSWLFRRPSCKRFNVGDVMGRLACAGIARPPRNNSLSIAPRVCESGTDDFLPAQLGLALAILSSREQLP